MSKQLWISLLIGLGVVGIGLGVVLVSTKGAHLELKGEILKVRVLALNPNASLVIADFRATNPSDVLFVVSTVGMRLDPLSGQPVEGVSISKPDVDSVFQYEKLLGGKYNDVLGIRDKIAPHQTVDRMAGARFELPESRIDVRKSIHLLIVDVDGATAELAEKR